MIKVLLLTVNKGLTIDAVRMTTLRRNILMNISRILQTIHISRLGGSNSEDVVQRVPRRGADPPTNTSYSRHNWGEVTE